MIYLRIEIFEDTNALIYFMVPLPECVYLLKGGGDDTSYVTQGLPVPGKLQGEGQIRITKGCCISHGIDQLQAAPSSNCSYSNHIRSDCLFTDVITTLCLRCLIHNLFDWLRAIVSLQHIPQLLVCQRTYPLVLFHGELPSVPEERGLIEWPTNAHLPLPPLSAVLVDLLRNRLPLIELVRHEGRNLMRLQLLDCVGLQHMLHNRVVGHAPLLENFLHQRIFLTVFHLPFLAARLILIISAKQTLEAKRAMHSIFQTFRQVLLFLVFPITHGRCCRNQIFIPGLIGVLIIRLLPRGELHILHLSHVLGGAVARGGFAPEPLS
mmetsp:Transcript_26955/g.62208  ORF Transcript_26955/g.62208 Transcript_26955/m.62208 type:complete len:322 (+) Transcript_26955:689-1654(+)